MSEPASELADAGASVDGSASEEFARVLGVSALSSRRLAQAGYTTVASVRELSSGTLEGLGISPEDVDRIRSGPRDPSNGGSSLLETTPESDREQIANRWVDSVHRTERPRRRRVSTPAADSTQVVRKWVQGDDSAMEAWIRSSEEAPPAPIRSTPLTETHTTELSTFSPAGALPAALIEREETVVRWLTALLDRVKAEQFDPASLLQELQDLQRQLYDERSRRKIREDEVEHVKRGSIAVIKYVRNREAKEREVALQAKDAEIAELQAKLMAQDPSGRSTSAAAIAPASIGTASSPGTEQTNRETERKLREEFGEREHTFIERETELRRRMVQLEGEVRSLRNDAARVGDRESMLQKERSALSDDLTARLKQVDGSERDLVTRENELRARFEEIRIASEELDRRRTPLEFKEKELAAWEQQLQTRKQALDLESRRVEQARAAAATGTSAAVTEQTQRLDDLRNDLRGKEEELRNRETLLHERLVELEKLQGQAAQTQADEFYAEAVSTATESKVRSGVRRLDDLLFGGYPVGSQLLVNGPAHTGKEVLSRLFAVEGLKAGVPVIWVVTDKTYLQIREEMTQLLPSYPELEKKGMVRCADLYSRSVGVQQSDAAVRLLSATDKGVLDQLTTAVNGFTQEFKEKYPTYRLIFESVSTVTAYLDTAATFRFLQPFAGRRKMDGAASYYLLETGMHSESDLQTLEHMVDGSINLKVDQLKTFLSVRGVTDVQSRAWVGYTFTKKSFSLGSFSLDHIR